METGTIVKTFPSYKKHFWVQMHLSIQNDTLIFIHIKITTEVSWKFIELQHLALKCLNIQKSYIYSKMKPVYILSRSHNCYDFIFIHTYMWVCTCTYAAEVPRWKNILLQRNTKPVGFKILFCESNWQKTREHYLQCLKRERTWSNYFMPNRVLFNKCRKQEDIFM